MTATPIPRTLAMTAYADLDCSIIDELPSGRKRVETSVISSLRRNDVVQRVKKACEDGRQAYWVCTLIEESDQRLKVNERVYVLTSLPEDATQLKRRRRIIVHAFHPNHENAH